MLSETHWQLSEAILNAAGERTARIDIRAFRWGCCLPDLFWGYPEHTLEKSITYLSGLLAELQNISAANYLQVSRCFSYKLGMATHYICDYFCRAHNEGYYDRLVPHLLYENRLQSTFSRMNMSQLRKSAMDCPLKVSEPGQNALPDLIQFQHMHYSAETPEMKKDIYFAVNTAVTLISVLVNLPQIIIPQAA